MYTELHLSNGIFPLATSPTYVYSEEVNNCAESLHRAQQPIAAKVGDYRHFDKKGDINNSKRIGFVHSARRLSVSGANVKRGSDFMWYSGLVQEPFEPELDWTLESQRLRSPYTYFRGNSDPGSSQSPLIHTKRSDMSPLCKFHSPAPLQPPTAAQDAVRGGPEEVTGIAGIADIAGITPW